MEATIDAAGRILLPKALRDACGLAPGTKVDIAAYGAALQITPGGRTAAIDVNEWGRAVAHSNTVVTDEAMFALIDAGRR